jgi:hypothetical protein
MKNRLRQNLINAMLLAIVIISLANTFPAATDGDILEVWFWGLLFGMFFTLLWSNAIWLIE